MTKEEMRAALAASADPSAAQYMKKVISDTRYPMLYVRMAPLRRVAKTAARESWLSLAEGPFEFYEEVLCAGLAVTYANAPLQDRLDVLRRLLRYVDSWGMTDSMVATLRFARAEQQLLWDFALECLRDTGAYTVRFGVVLLLRFFSGEAERVMQVLRDIRDERYYVQMAVAWCFAEIAVIDYEAVKKVLESGELSKFIHNKTIQKIRESYRISDKKKEAALRLRRR